VSAAPASGTQRPDPSIAGGSGRLLQALGVAFGLAIIIGNTIGIGILRTPGEIALRLPSVPLFLGVWVLGGLYALLGALSLAELGAAIPRSGGQYVFVKRALGSYPGFVTGWSDWLSTCATLAAVGIVLGEYAGPLVPALGGREHATAIFVVLLFSLLQWRGIRLGDATQQFTSLLKAIALLALACAAFLLVSNATPAAEPATVPSGFAFVAAAVVAFQSVIFTYDGWTGPIYFGEEVKDPGRDVPRAMIGGVLLVLFIYLALNIAFLRVVPIADMAGDPFVAATAASRMFGTNGDTILRAVMIVSLLAAANANLLMASRVPFALSRDRMLPAGVTRVNAGGTPEVSLFASTLVTLGFVVTNTFDTVLAIIAFFFVANYVLSFTSLFVLRRREPDLARPFRVPGYPFTTGIALLGSVAFLVAAVLGDAANSLRALALLAISVPAYLVIRRRSAR
jgi:APA family basic amino acid/polyamine antiporter